MADPTFRSFNHEQGQNYAEHRRGYHHKFYEILLDRHTSTGGQLDTVLDVGCGPGMAVRALAPRFAHAIGLDPSEGMTSTARSLGGTSSTSEPILFHISTAEDLGANLSPPIPDGSVDLITAATAAHWFNMSHFWPRAAQVLKPGGSVALWTTSTIRVDSSVPNCVAIQSAIDNLSAQLTDYMLPGNLLARGLYTNLPLPWMLATPVLEFDETTFWRKEWNTGDESTPEDEIFGAQQPANLDVLEKILGTTSPVARWREAHPDAVGTEDDLVRITRRDIERSLHEAGVEEGKELLKACVQGVLLVVKRK
ncbi:hypothetical protein B7463_g11780, partial [Scytalidium lignicola]